MKIYLAARYSRREELVGYQKQLESLGHQITSRWLLGGHQITDGQLLGSIGENIVESGSPEAAAKLRTRFAQEDWIDLMAADLCISFTEQPRTTKTRGGRHVEFGAALAADKQCVVIGFRENVFHCLPRVQFFGHFDDYLATLTSEEVAA